ncbi:hypothetical protein L7F22_021649 [Adiantum nelumboides]|nr:hypothetical protein [Adiantum nelumboides]
MYTSTAALSLASPALGRWGAHMRTAGPLVRWPSSDKQSHLLAHMQTRRWLNGSADGSIRQQWQALKLASNATYSLSQLLQTCSQLLESLGLSASLPPLRSAKPHMNVVKGGRFITMGAAGGRSKKVQGHADVALFLVESRSFRAACASHKRQAAFPLSSHSLLLLCASEGAAPQRSLCQALRRTSTACSPAIKFGFVAGLGWALLLLLVPSLAARYNVSQLLLLAISFCTQGLDWAAPAHPPSSSLAKGYF